MALTNAGKTTGSTLQPKGLIGMDAPPLLDYGSQLCLPYLLKQGCWSTCNHANTHNYALTAAEKTRDITYLQSQMQKLHPAATSGQPRANTSG